MGLGIKLKIVLVSSILIIMSTALVGLSVKELSGTGQEPLIPVVYVGIFILALAAVIIFAFRLMGPVDELIIGTQLVAQGRLDHRIKKRSGDEIGRLVDSFNNMTSRLKKSREKSDQFCNLANVEKRKAELILDSMADGVIVTDEHHDVLLFNPAAEHLFDTSTPAVHGNHIMNFLKKYKMEDLFIDMPEIKDKMLPERDTTTKVREFKLEKLGEKVLKASIAPLKNQSNVVIGSVIVFEDITKLREVDQMKTEFVSTVSHELRTPLTSIKGYAALMADGRLGELSEQQQKSIDIINQESDRLTDLINDILDLSKMEAGRAPAKYEMADIHDIIKAATVINVAKAKGIEVRKIVPDDVPQVMMDKAKIVQVLNNLISNAVKFTKKGGKITIKVLKKPEHLQVDIIDTGIGIPKKDIPKLFNKFYQVESHLTRNQGGTGLGLPIVKEIIGLHHGLICVQSKLHKGTTVSFAIPKIQPTDPPLEKCWEKRGCKKVKCPAYQSRDKRCWLCIGTYCKKNSNEACIDKIGLCSYCDIYKKAISGENDV